MYLFFNQQIQSRYASFTTQDVIYQAHLWTFLYFSFFCIFSPDFTLYASQQRELAGKAVFLHNK